MRLTGIRQCALTVITAGAIALTASACNSHQPSSVHVNPSAKAHAEKILSKCIPSDPMGQISLAKSLATTSGRSALVAKCGIPQSNRADAEAKILGAAEHGHLTTKNGRTQFFTVTLPTIIEQEQM